MCEPAGFGRGGSLQTRKLSDPDYEKVLVPSLQSRDDGDASNGEKVVSQLPRGFLDRIELPSRRRIDLAEVEAIIRTRP